MAEIFAENGWFHLRNARVSYLVKLVRGAWPMHVHYGARLESTPNDPLRRFCSVDENDFSRNELLLDGLPQEWPTFGNGDLREGALHISFPAGDRVLDLRYRSHEISPGKPALDGLPATFGGDCQTLRLTLGDESVACDLYYTIFEDCDIVARHAEIRNTGDEPFLIEQCASASVDLPRSDFDLLTLSGAWSRERRMDARPLAQGTQGVSSARGASSLQASPFLALMDKRATETFGEVLAMALVYSGNFRASADVDQYGQTRVRIGLNDFDFAWRLEPGERFTTPEAVLCWSGEGLGGMSRQFHTLCREHLTRGRFSHAPRPYLLNNWEATYFDFNEAKLLALAEKAAQIGVELFVLDDGWFGRRDADDCSLGDWTEDRRKLPDGLEGLSQKIHALGLKFGLWFEPEMVSPDSDLYRAHPDWCIHVPGRERLEQRRQLVLDLSRPEVCEHVYHAVADVLTRAQIDYVKWDMNRNFSPIGSAALPPERQKELPHRYLLGLYGVLGRLNAAFPDVLFESCASGGGRFDLGMLYYMPQTWCSDNTDAISRCQIQYGTSLVFPPCAMGAHVSAVPNHQTGRVTPLQTRSDVAMGGTYGFELDLTRLPESELAQMRGLLARVQSVRETLLYGTFYRLRSPFDTNYAAWMTVSPDRREAVVTCVKLRAESNIKLDALRLTGLDPKLRYRSEKGGVSWGGDELMTLGMILDFATGDAASLSCILRAE